MKVETHACDNCRKQKQETNRWWNIYTVPGGVVVVAWDQQPPDGSTERSDLCGANCVSEWLSKNLL